MDQLQPTEAKTELFGLVRDSHGNPKFDDINNIPGPIWGMLSSKEQSAILAQRKNHKPNRSK